MAGSALRVLIADDNARVRHALGSMLRSSAGFEVVGEAEDGQQAVQHALTLRPDIVLMDVQMPHLDGLQATQRICAAWPQARVVVLTGLDGQERPARAAGAVDYVPKDVLPQELLARVQQAASIERAPARRRAARRSPSARR